VTHLCYSDFGKCEQQEGREGRGGERLKITQIKKTCELTHYHYPALLPPPPNTEEILGAIDALDADVLTIENSRSGDEMVKALAAYGYSRDLGPGVYDVHSPVVPSVESMAAKARAYVAAGIDVSKIWLNPDCGLKTRRWEEVLPSLRNMVAAAKLVREEMAAASAGGKGQVSGVKAAH